METDPADAAGLRQKDGLEAAIALHRNRFPRCCERNGNRSGWKTTGAGVYWRHGSRHYQNRRIRWPDRGHPWCLPGQAEGRSHCHWNLHRGCCCPSFRRAVEAARPRFPAHRQPSQLTKRNILQTDPFHALDSRNKKGTMFLICSCMESSDVENVRGRSRCAGVDYAVCRDDCGLGAADSPALGWSGERPRLASRRGLCGPFCSPWGKAGWRARGVPSTWTPLAQRITIGAGESVLGEVP